MVLINSSFGKDTAAPGVSEACVSGAHCAVSRDRSLRVARELAWPLLGELRLTEQALVERSTGVGGSDANVIASGDGDRVLRLWEEKRGVRDPEDLSDRLPVMLGCWTEAFNCQWFEKATGQLVTRRGDAIVCKKNDWRRCTLDGFVDLRGAVWEAKHTSAFAKEEEVLARYMPQLQHNMAVAESELAILSVIYGNQRWEVYEIASDWLYQQELLDAEAQFWQCVLNGIPPVPVEPPPPPRAAGVREVCFEGSNIWAAAADDWRRYRDAARLHSSAAVTLKSLVEDNVSRAHGHKVEVKRTKAGALTIREILS
jgi:hypothetical protein